MWNQDTDVSSNATAFEAKGYGTPHFEQLGVIYIYVYQIYRIIKKIIFSPT